LTQRNKAEMRAELERLMANFKGETKICPPARIIACVCRKLHPF
jgi:hypothetical protein